MKFNLKKLSAIALVAFASLVPLLFPQMAHASLLGIGDIAGSAIGWIFYITAYVISWVGGVFVAILGWATGSILEISSGIVNSATVRAGFPITLAIANLGFVLAVIIIAVATILRRQSYGVKTLLYKVVLMAVLVNFGLVLSGAVLNFSDSITTYYLNSLTGGGGPKAFADKFTASFKPQTYVIGGANTAAGNSTTTDTADAQAIKGAGDSIQGILKPLVSLILQIVGIIMIVITLTTLIVMLVIRYITLALLLILLPLAWMAWVFPGIAKYFSQWWDKFIQQAFFPPIVLFFLWLGITTSQNFNTVPVDTGKNIGQGIGALFTGTVMGLMQQVLNTVVLCGMMFGGIYVANKLGIEGAKVGNKMTDGIKGWAQGKASRTGRAIVSRPFRGAAAQKTAENLMKSESFPARLLGRGMAMVGRTGGANVVAEWEKKHGGKSKEQLLEELRASPLGTTEQERVAILNLLSKKEGLKDLTSEEVEKYAGRSSFEKTGSTKTYGDIEKALGPESMRAARKIMDDPKAGPNTMVDDVEGILGEKGAKVRAEDLYKKSAEKFISKMDKSGAGKVPWDKLMEGPMADELIAQIEAVNPALVSTILGKLSGKNQDIFNEKYAAALEREEDKLKAEEAALGGPEDREKSVAEFNRQIEELNKNLQLPLDVVGQAKYADMEKRLEEITKKKADYESAPPAAPTKESAELKKKKAALEKKRKAYESAPWVAAMSGGEGESKPAEEKPAGGDKSGKGGDSDKGDKDKK